MIAFALPWVFGAAVAAALGVGVLHLLSVRNPPELLLPTARFLPDRDIRAVSRTRRPSDLSLLVVRVLLLLLAGFAAAGPRWTTGRSVRGVVIVADESLRGDSAAVRALVTDVPADAVVAMDFAGAVAGNVTGDSAAAELRARRVGEPAHLLVRAWRAAARLSAASPEIDSIDLHVVTRAQPSAGDDAWTAWRSAWPGRVTLHTSTQDPRASRGRRVFVVDAESGGTAGAVGERVAGAAFGDDVVRAAMRWHAAHARVARVMAEAAGRAPVTSVVNASVGDVAIDTIALVRGADDVAATARMRASSMRTIVHWPVNGIPRGWSANAASMTDSVLALASAGQSIGGPWTVPATPGPSDASGRAIAWWSDGRVAATERRVDGVCERDVAVVPSSSSDALLSSASNEFFTQLLTPCKREVIPAVNTLTVRAVDGGAVAQASLFRGARGAGDMLSNAFTAALIALALLGLALEWWLRQRSAREPT
jgi:hypothetical protein